MNLFGPINFIFPTFTLSGVHNRDCSTGYQIITVIMLYEEVRKNRIIEIIQVKRLMMIPSAYRVDLATISVISD